MRVTTLDRDIKSRRFLLLLISLSKLLVKVGLLDWLVQRFSKCETLAAWGCGDVVGKLTVARGLAFYAHQLVFEVVVASIEMILRN